MGRRRLRRAHVRHREGAGALPDGRRRHLRRRRLHRLDRDHLRGGAGGHHHRVHGNRDPRKCNRRPHSQEHRQIRNLLGGAVRHRRRRRRVLHDVQGRHAAGRRQDHHLGAQEVDVGVEMSMELRRRQHRRQNFGSTRRTAASASRRRTGDRQFGCGGGAGDLRQDEGDSSTRASAFTARATSLAPRAPAVAAGLAAAAADAGVAPIIFDTSKVDGDGNPSSTRVARSSATRACSPAARRRCSS